MTFFWYVIQSHPNKEQLLYKQVLNQGIEVFFPRIRVKPVNPRARKIRPYFPSYLFLKTTKENINSSSIKWIPYSKGVVSFGGEASIVPDKLISTLKQKLGDGENIIFEHKQEIDSGAPIIIEYGPFKGYEGIFDSMLDGSDRVRILLKMLSDQYIPVELELSQIKKKRSKPNKT